ncbi:MAG: hypothetical protein U5L45_15760 [Saprospiraceae bacterium]|nr:hypothetical protein [Saprospiraceae bacterium]
MSHLTAQQFYHFEDFFEDSAFIIAKNIKSVTVRMPDLMSDTSETEYLPLQKLCFNPFGKLAKYEFNLLPENRRKPFGFIENYYNEAARCFRSYRFHRGKDERDSIREVILYDYDEEGKLTIESHHQMQIGEYNEYSINYEWFADSFRLQLAEENKMDSVRFDEKHRAVMFSQNGVIYYPFFDEKTGIRTRMKRFVRDESTDQAIEISELTYIYDDNKRLIRVETVGREVIFLYDFNGLPISSMIRDRSSGKQIGWQVQYEYEFR